jgi:hypothetical protein
MPYITTKKTIAAETQAKARTIAAGAVQSVRSCLTALAALQEDRGGRQALIAELGDDAQPLGQFVAACKTFTKAVSDLADDDLADVG